MKQKTASPTARMTKAALLKELNKKDRQIGRLQDEVLSLSMYAERIEIALEMVSNAFSVTSAYVHNSLRKKQLADHLANMREIARSQPSVANWVVKGFTFVADGIKFTVTHIEGTQSLSKIAALRLNGDERNSTLTYVGKAVISYRLPVIGEVLTQGNLIHVESTNDRMNTTVIDNKLTFEIEVEGIKRVFTLDAGGDLYEGELFAFTVNREMSAGIDRTLCDLGCKKVHSPEELHNRPIGFDVTIEMNK